MVKVEIKSLSELDQAAASIIDSIEGVRKVAFSGEMGAGKTTIIQALCRVLGVEDIVNSPTFSLINEYFTVAGDSIYHFDLYRIENLSELFDMGYEEYFYSDSWCFIEWPEKALELMPEDILMLHIDVMDNGTRVIHT